MSAYESVTSESFDSVIYINENKSFAEKDPFGKELYQKIPVLCSWGHFVLTVGKLQLLRQRDNTVGPVVRKPINANPGLQVNQAFNFSCINVFFSANVV